MKKMIAGFLLGTMVFMLVACAPQNKVTEATEADIQKVDTTEAGTQEAESIAIDAPEEETYAGMSGMANPWVDSDKLGVFEATGFDLVAPTGAANVAYSYMPSTGMAQMNFTMDNAMWVYRVQPTDALEDISGIYCEWNYTGETKVAGMDAMEYSYASTPAGEFIDNMDCTRVINWYDAQNKVTHSLSVIGKDLNGMDTALYAEKLFYPASGAPESDGIGPISEETAKGLLESDLYKSFLGRHVSGNDGSEITVEEGGENGRLKLNVSLFRLCSLDDGVGIYEYDTVSFHATDPSGNRIRCCLYYNSDNSLCLKVEESTWTYLPAGTVISGFDN